MEEKTAIILSLFRSDYTVSLHARAMAKCLSLSHMTLMPHLKRLEELKILHSEVVGKNKQYTLNKDNILTKYYLVNAEEQVTIQYLHDNFLMKQLAESLSDLDILGTILIFGSYVKGYANEESDIDLFVIGRLMEENRSAIEKFAA